MQSTQKIKKKKTMNFFFTFIFLYKKVDILLEKIFGKV